MELISYIEDKAGVQYENLIQAVLLQSLAFKSWENSLEIVKKSENLEGWSNLELLMIGYFCSTKGIGPKDQLNRVMKTVLGRQEITKHKYDRKIYKAILYSNLITQASESTSKNSDGNALSMHKKYSDQLKTNTPTFSLGDLKVSAVGLQAFLRRNIRESAMCKFSIELTLHTLENCKFCNLKTKDLYPLYSQLSLSINKMEFIDQFNAYKRMIQTLPSHRDEIKQTYFIETTNLSSKTKELGNYLIFKEVFTKLERSYDLLRNQYRKDSSVAPSTDLFEPIWKSLYEICTLSRYSHYFQDSSEALQLAIILLLSITTDMYADAVPTVSESDESTKHIDIVYELIKSKEDTKILGKSFFRVLSFWKLKGYDRYVKKYIDNDEDRILIFGTESKKEAIEKLSQKQ